MQKSKTLPFDFTQYMMLRAMAGYCTQHQLTINQVPSFAANVTTVKNNINMIEGFLGMGGMNITGNALTKKELKTALARAMMNVCGPVCAFAKATGKNDLLMASQGSYTKLFEKRDALLIADAIQLVAISFVYISELSDYGVSDDQFAAIDTARTAFTNAIAAPRLMSIESSQHRQSAAQLLQQSMRITRTVLDPLCNAFITLGNQTFVDGYLQSRKLVPYGTLHTRASVSVIMGDSNAPVQYATVRVINTELTGNTNVDGHVTISHVPMGLQSLIVNAPGFPNPVQTAPFNFIKGKATHITINMTEFAIPASVNAPSQPQTV